MAVSSSSPRGSRLISRVLPVAVKLWLQTQLDEVGELAFEIQAADRQVLSGYIPRVVLSAQNAVYQGVHITDVHVHASDIKINIGQVLRGKSLQLQQSFPIEGNVVLDGEALETSSTASVLAEGLLDFWRALLARTDVVAEVVTHYGHDMMALQALRSGQYQCRLTTIDTDLVLHLIKQGQSAICLRGWLLVDGGHILKLMEARWCLPSGTDVPSDALSGFCWDLGEQTDVQSLTVQADRLTCQCRIMVQP